MLEHQVPGWPAELGLIGQRSDRRIEVRVRPSHRRRSTRERLHPLEMYRELGPVAIPANVD